MRIDFNEIKKYKGYIIIFITLIQFIIFIPSVKEENENVIDVNLELPSIEGVSRDIASVKDELSKNKNLKILKIEDLQGKLDIKIAIEGERDIILESLKKISEYDIYNYNIEGKNNEIILYLQLYI